MRQIQPLIRTIVILLMLQSCISLSTASTSNAENYETSKPQGFLMQELTKGLMKLKKTFLPV